MAPVGVIDREVHIAGDWTRRADFQYAFEAGDLHLRDVDRGHDGRSGHRGVVYSGGAVLPIRRNLADHTERKAVDKAELEEVIPLRKCWRGPHAALGRARDGTEIFHVRGQE